jgi:hypothetical protein
MTLTAGVMVAGTNGGSTILQNTAVAASFTLFTLVSNNSVSDLTINLTSTNAAITVIGIEFSGTSNANSAVNRCNIFLDATATTTAINNMACINNAGTSTTATSGFFNANSCQCLHNANGPAATFKAAFLNNAVGTFNIQGGSYICRQIAGAAAFSGILNSSTGLTNLVDCNCDATQVGGTGTPTDVLASAGTITVAAGVTMRQGQAGSNFTCLPGCGSQMYTIAHLAAAPASLTRFLPLSGIFAATVANASEAAAEITTPRIMVAKNLVVTTIAATSTSVYTLRVNGVSTTLTVSAVAAGTFSDTTHVITIPAGAKVDYQVVFGAATVASSFIINLEMW